MDQASIPLGGSSGGRRLEEESGFSLLGDQGTSFAAGFGFAVKGLRDGGGSAHLAQPQHFDFKVAAFISDP